MLADGRAALAVEPSDSLGNLVIQPSCILRECLEMSPHDHPADSESSGYRVLAELRAADRDYWAHEAHVSGDVALHLAGLIADAEGGDAMRAVEIERAAREELHPTA